MQLNVVPPPVINYNFTDHSKTVFNQDVSISMLPQSVLPYAARFCSMDHSILIKKIISNALKVFFYLAVPAGACALAACAVFSPLSLAGYLTGGILVKIAYVAASVGLGLISYKFHEEYTVQKEDLILATFFEKLNLSVYDESQEVLRIGRAPTAPLWTNFKETSPILQFWTKGKVQPVYLIRFKDDKDIFYISYLTKTSHYAGDISAKWGCITLCYNKNGSSEPCGNQFWFPSWLSPTFNENFSRLKTLVERNEVTCVRNGVNTKYTLC